MKKLLTLLAVALLGIGTTYAQTAQQSTTTSTQKTHMTKAGTPDKRYKDNKTSTTTTAPAAPTKKDGTADMRYKANKTTTTKTATKPKQWALLTGKGQTVKPGWLPGFTVCIQYLFCSSVYAWAERVKPQENNAYLPCRPARLAG